MSSAYFKQEKRGKQNELNSYQRRKRQLETIRSAFQGSFDDYADTITAKSNKVKQSLEEGIKIVGGSVASENIFKREAGADDGNLSQSRNYIDAEIRDVESQILGLERKIKNLDTRIASEKQKEDEERKKALQTAFHR